MRNHHSETARHALGDKIRRGVVVGFEHAWNEKEHIMDNTLYVRTPVEGEVLVLPAASGAILIFRLPGGSINEKIDTFTNGE